MHRRRQNNVRSQTTDPLLQKYDTTPASESTHSLYSQRHRVRPGGGGGVGVDGSTSTLCPYHHHLKYHLSGTTSTDFLSSGCTSDVNDDVDGKLSFKTNPHSSFPLLVINTVPSQLSGSTAVYDQTRFAHACTSPNKLHSCASHKVVAGESHADIQQTSFMQSRLAFNPPQPDGSTVDSVDDSVYTPVECVPVMGPKESCRDQQTGDCNPPEFDLIRYSQQSHVGPTLTAQNGCTRHMSCT